MVLEEEQERPKVAIIDQTQSKKSNSNPLATVPAQGCDCGIVGLWIVCGICLGLFWGGFCLADGGSCWQPEYYTLVGRYLLGSIRR